MGGRGGEGRSRAKPGNQLVYIYIYQSANVCSLYVRWNNATSSGFKRSNGVRQGGIFITVPVLCIIMLTN